MSQTPPTHQADCDTGATGLLTVEQALTRIRDALQPISGYEKLGLRDALGRILAEDVLSPLDVPGQDNSAMDGFAVHYADLPASGSAVLKVCGEAFAGKPFIGQCETGQAVRIMTGAVIPAGTDTVIMQEQVQRSGDEIVVGPGHELGENVRRAGEDLARGKTVLGQGKRLNPAELGLLASLGIPEVSVRRRLRVATFSTGDELCALGEVLGDGQIYDSNRYSLYGMLTRIGAEVIDMGVIRDRRDDIAQALLQAADVADVIITSGGVSVGDADYVKEVLELHGKINFWKIAMKPGKPLAFGKVGQAVFFGLPGNPVSVMATFYQIVQPSLKYLQGQKGTFALRLKLPCRERLKKRPGRQDFQRGILEVGNDGQLGVRSTGHQGSHMLSSMSRANCFIILPAESGDIEPGSLVEVEPFEGLLG